MNKMFKAYKSSEKVITSFWLQIKSSDKVITSCLYLWKWIILDRQVIAATAFSVYKPDALKVVPTPYLSYVYKVTHMLNKSQNMAECEDS